jgi:hypothetical protein
MAEDVDSTEQTATSSGSTGGSSGGQSQTTGPVGSGNYEVQQGDCIESIAFEHGHFWETIWNHPDNQQLKSLRRDPNVLLAGDKVFVPDLRPKDESGATEQRHSFKRKGVPSKLRIVLKDENDQPRADVPYTLEIDGQLFSGQTDGQGGLQHRIPPDAKQGKLTIGTGDEAEEHELQLGHIDPITEVSGVQARLNNLGFDSGAIDGELGPQTKDAIRAFQAEYGLPVTGEPDQATRDKLKEEHGS